MGIYRHIGMPSKKDEKIPLSVVKKFPYKTLNRFITKAKKYLKTDQVWIDICKEYGEEPDIIDLIPVMFGDLEVSAKTDHGIIILNYKLLTDGDFFKDYSYLIHEGTHVFQQCFGEKPTRSSDDGEYLHNPAEQEGFANQVEYIDETFGKQEAENYVDDLLEHHEIDDKKEKRELEDILLSKV
jgi:hypothetical protein